MENKQPSIREIDATSDVEIAVVATNMRRTLVEVLGLEKGTALYSMDWLVDRVRWHLDSQQAPAKVFIAEMSGRIISHAIARVETETDGTLYGYFSTIFVEPEWRNKGIAASMLSHTVSWLESMRMPKIIYNTAENHSKLIRIFERNGFVITHRENEMIQLTKPVARVKSIEAISN